MLGVRAGVVGMASAILLARQTPVAASWSPSPYPVWLRPGTSDAIAFRDVLLEEQYDFALDRAPRTIIDAGANIGLSSIWFSVRYPDAKIVAVEAERSNYELMVRNVAKFSNVIPLHAALWSHRGLLAVHDPGMGAWAFQTSELGEGTGSGTTVESLSVRDIMDDHGIDRVDLLKVDIEGAEQEVFSDPASSAWIGSVDSIAIELHDRFRPGCARAFYSRVGDFPIEATRRDTTFVARRAAP